jgi:hypothetical protein
MLCRPKPTTRAISAIGLSASYIAFTAASFSADTFNGRVRAAGGRLTLLNPTPVVREVFQITRLDTVLEVAKLPA